MVYIDHLFDNLKCGKRKYCFGKKSGKRLEFWIHYSFYPSVAISWLCIWNFINSLCSMFFFMSCYSLYLEQYTSSITPAGQITVFQKTQAMYYVFFLKWTQDNSPFQWLGQLLFIAGTWKLFYYCLKSGQDCIIRFKNSKQSREFSHLIIHDCEIFKCLKILILILALIFRFGVILV